MPPSCSTVPAALDEYSSQLSKYEQEQILHLQQAILESVARGDDHLDVINRVCNLEEQLLPNSVGSVMLLDSAHEALNVYAAPSIPDEGHARLNGLRPGPGAGSCGNVVYQKAPQYVSNTFTDPRWQDLRQLAYDFNLCACWSVPIYSAERQIVGTFALSSFEHRAPTEFHKRILEIGASIIGIVLDRHKTQSSMRLFQKVMEGSEEGFIVTDAQGKILLINRAFSKVFGYTQDELIGRNPSFLSSGHHDPSFYTAMWHSIRTFGHWHGEIWNRRKNGEVFPEWLSISAVNDQANHTTHYIGIFSDLSDKKNAEATIQYLSSHDVLTGLPNRVLFQDRLDNALSYASRASTKVGLLALNVDNFKLLNDSLGHAAGDQLLTQIAQRLSQSVSEGNAICRQSGDEFLIALTDVQDMETVTSTAMGLLEQVRAPIQLDDKTLSLSCSIGVAIYPDDAEDGGKLLQAATKALDNAKEAGRNTYRFFTEQLNTDGLEHLRIAQGLRQAIANREFVLHYQPQIDLRTRQISGAEALIRWQHPTDGLLSPIRFIDIAEQTGLIVDIGDWVLEEACRQAKAWQDSGLPPVTVAVNVSAVQFRSGKLEASVRRALETSGLAPQWLELELTESVLVHDTDNMIGLFERLKSLGVKLSIDDFGTGYSSLAYLKKFNIDRLKIDQSFVREMATDANDAAIVRAIIQMAHTLNLRAVAEGVESELVTAQLGLCECDEVQGYHFARPMPGGELASMLKSAS
ncbi:MAG: bifunctional diguanylate cyclase/phosphodiesterase [Aquabacterium sp.]|uniref:bifunctional diguanylate cyclase/phosphodiesterase n=1 Tax=Aquabacterium sp. TaxID=1872578 RepID=UPI003BBB6CE8